MSDSDSGVVHAFDQTNGVIAATGEERDGALSGTTSADMVDPTGSAVAIGSGAAPDADADGGDDPADDAGGEAADDGTEVAAAQVAEPAAESGPAEDFAPTSELPLPGDAAAAEEGDEHTYAVDSAGEATDEGLTAEVDPVYDAAYSGAPAVAERSAADDGRDELTTRSESSTEPIDDASHTGRLADAYAAGPADEVGGQDAAPAEQAEPVDETEPVDEAEPVDEVVADEVVVVDETVAADDGLAADPESAVATTDDEDAPTGTAPGSLAALVGDEDGITPIHLFDQTNGVVDGLDGDSDGSAESDVLAGRVRDLESPMIEDAEVRSDDDGVHDIEDPNP